MTVLRLLSEHSSIPPITLQDLKVITGCDGIYIIPMLGKLKKEDHGWVNSMNYKEGYCAESKSDKVVKETKTTTN